MNAMVMNMILMIFNYDDRDVGYDDCLVMIIMIIHDVKCWLTSLPGSS